LRGDCPCANSPEVRGKKVITKINLRIYLYGKSKTLGNFNFFSPEY
jgi:hypothetical protein